MCGDLGRATSGDHPSQVLQSSVKELKVTFCVLQRHTYLHRLYFPRLDQDLTQSELMKVRRLILEVARIAGF